MKSAYNHHFFHLFFFSVLSFLITCQSSSAAHASTELRSIKNVPMTAVTRCAESNVVTMSANGPSLQITLYDLSSESPNYFAMYFPQGHTYTISLTNPDTNAILSLYTGCGGADGTVLALNRSLYSSSSSSVAFEAWNYSSVVAEVRASASRLAFIVQPLATSTALSSSGATVAVRSFATLPVATSYDSGSGLRPHNGPDLRQLTALHFDMVLSMLASLRVEVRAESSKDYSGITSLMTSSNISGEPLAVLRENSWAECCVNETVPGGFAVVMNASCLDSVKGENTGLLALVVALEDPQYPIIGRNVAVTAAGVLRNGHCEDAVGFVYDTDIDHLKVPAASVTEAPGGPEAVYWYEMSVTGESNMVYLSTECASVQAYTDCDMGSPENVTTAPFNVGFWGEAASKYPIALTGCPKSFGLSVRSQFYSYSSSSSSSSSDGSPLSTGSGDSGSDGSAKSALSSNSNSNGNSGSGSSSSNNNNIIVSSSDKTNNNSGGSKWAVVAAVFVLAFLVAIIGIAVMVVVVRKKREADRLERESRDLVLAFDDYNYDDDELDDIDDINDDVRLLKLGKNERHSKQFKHDDGSIPV